VAGQGGRELFLPFMNNRGCLLLWSRWEAHAQITFGLPRKLGDLGFDEIEIPRMRRGNRREARWW